MKQINELWEKLADVELIQVRPSEMEAMYKHCFEFKAPTIIEIGSAHGASSIILAEAVKELGGLLYCIDHFPEEYYGQDKFGSYGRKKFLKNIKPHSQWVRYMDMPSHEALAGIQNQFAGINEVQCDVLFIDGMHSYEAVKSDCELYLPVLKSGGYVGFHDYNNVAFQVKQAADEFCKDWQKESVWDLAIFKKP